MASLVLLIVFALCLLYLLEPIFKKNVHSDSINFVVHRNLEIRKRLVLEGLKDLDLDNQAKKMDNADYESLKADLMAEGALVLKEIESEENDK